MLKLQTKKIYSIVEIYKILNLLKGDLLLQNKELGMKVYMKGYTENNINKVIFKIIVFNINNIETNKLKEKKYYLELSFITELKDEMNIHLKEELEEITKGEFIFLNTNEKIDDNKVFLLFSLESLIIDKILLTSVIGTKEFNIYSIEEDDWRSDEIIEIPTTEGL